jgi:hypothetical protein
MTVDTIADQDGSDGSGVVGWEGGFSGWREGEATTPCRGAWVGDGLAGEELFEGDGEVMGAGFGEFGTFDKLIIDGALINDALVIETDDDDFGCPFDAEGEGNELAWVPEVGEVADTQIHDLAEGIAKGVVGVGVDDPELDALRAEPMGEFVEFRGAFTSDGATDAGEEEDDGLALGAIQFDVPTLEVEQGEIGDRAWGGAGGGHQTEVGEEQRGEPKDRSSGMGEP